MGSLAMIKYGPATLAALTAELDFRDELIAERTERRRKLVLWAAGCVQDVRYLINDEDLLDAIDCAIQTAVAWVCGGSGEDCQLAAYAVEALASDTADTLAAIAVARAAAVIADDPRIAAARADAAADDESLEARHRLELAAVLETL